MEGKSSIQTRLDYMEEKFDTKLGDMADAMTHLANQMGVLSEHVSDIRLLTERNNQHSASIKNLHEYCNKLDARVDEVEKKIPLIDRFMSRSDKISLTVTIMIIIGIIGSVIKFT